MNRYKPEKNRKYGSYWKPMIIRPLLVLMILSCFSGLAVAGNILILSDTQAGSGQIATIEVAISNDDPFVAFQFDLPLGTQLSYVNNSAALDQTRQNGHSLYVGIITGNILRIIVFSLSNTPFNGSSGTVLTFQLMTGSVPGNIALQPVNAVITNTSLQNILTGIQNGSVTILAPNISPGSTLLSFGSIPLYQTNDVSLNINNTGNQLLAVDSITFNSPYFSVNGSSTFGVNPGGSHNISVRFHSLLKGLYQKQMIIHSNDPDQGQVFIQLNATAFAVNELWCGSMLSYSGQPDTLHFTINNMEEFTGFQFDLTLPASLSYSTGSAVLSERKTDHIVFASMINSNTLRLVAFSPSNSCFTGIDGRIVSIVFNVFGTGGGYALNMSNVVITNLSLTNILSASYNGWLQVAAPDIHAPGSLSFGDVSVTDTASQNIRVYNYGQISLQISQLQFTNPAFWSVVPMPLAVPGGGYFDIPVSFHSPVKGSKQGLMRIISNDPDENPFTISLTANAFAPNYLILKDTTSYTIDTISVEIRIENHEPFVAFEFYMSLPPELSFVNNPGLTHLTTRAQDHLLYAGMVSPTMLRVFAFSLSQNYFHGNSGTVARIGLAVNSGQSNLNLPLTLSNVILVNNSMQNILYSWSNGSLHIQAPPFPYIVDLQNIILSFGSDTCIAAMQTVSMANVIFQSGSNTAISAGQSIRFLPGTRIENGSSLHAYVSPVAGFCSNKSEIFSENPMEYNEKTSRNGIAESPACYIYPNPTSGKFYFEPGGLASDIVLEIYNIQGERVLVRKEYNQQAVMIDLNGFPAGIYFLKANADGRQIFSKVVKY